MGWVTSSVTVRQMGHQGFLVRSSLLLAAAVLSESCRAFAHDKLTRVRSPLASNPVHISRISGRDRANLLSPFSCSTRGNANACTTRESMQQLGSRPEPVM